MRFLSLIVQFLTLDSYYINEAGRIVAREENR